MTRVICSHELYSTPHYQSIKCQLESRMKRIQIYLDAPTQALLADYAEQNEYSLSRAASKLIEATLLNQAQESDIRQENKQHFLRLLNVLNQVMMCVYDSKKVSIPSQSAQECLDLIKASILEQMEA